MAASGDTVRIGVGRFDDKRYYSFPGWSDSVRVVVHQYELTITGSGPETIIGQEEPWELEQGNHKGIVAGQLVGVLDNSILRVQDLTLENMEKGVDTSHELVDGCYVEIKDARFEGTGSRPPSTAPLPAKCSSSKTPSSTTSLATESSPRLGTGQIHAARIRTSRLTYDPIWNGTHLGAVECIRDCLLTNCQFIGGTACAIFTYSGPALIKNCRFEGQEGYML